MWVCFHLLGFPQIKSFKPQQSVPYRRGYFVTIGFCYDSAMILPSIRPHCAYSLIGEIAGIARKENQRIAFGFSGVTNLQSSQFQLVFFSL